MAKNFNTSPPSRLTPARKIVAPMEKFMSDLNNSNYTVIKEFPDNNRLIIKFEYPIGSVYDKAGNFIGTSQYGMMQMNQAGAVHIWPVKFNNLTTMDDSEKYIIIYLLSDCLLYQIRSNVRKVAVDWNEDVSRMTLYAFLDTVPNEKDTELMEDATDLYISFYNNYDITFDVNVQYSDAPMDKLYSGKKIMYARYEEQTI